MTNSFFIGDELTVVQAVVDQLHTDKTTLEQKVSDLEKNQLTPEKLELAAAERSAVIADAKALVATVKTEGCTCDQIKREVITAKTGDALVSALLGPVKIGDAKPEKIDTIFRALSAVKGTVPANPVGDAIIMQQQVTTGDGKPASEDVKLYHIPLQ